VKKISVKGFILLIVVGLITLSGDVIPFRNEAHAQTKTLGALLVEFENAVLWSAVDSKFKGRQQGWREECMAAHSGPDFARLLTEFESWVLWSGVDNKWKARRTAWIKDVRAAGAAGAAGALGNLLVEFESHVLWTAVNAGPWKARRNAWMNDCKNAAL
jgi:hypothetical protein